MRGLGRGIGSWDPPCVVDGGHAQGANAVLRMAASAPPYRSNLESHGPLSRRARVVGRKGRAVFTHERLYRSSSPLPLFVIYSVLVDGLVDVKFVAWFLFYGQFFVNQ